MASMNKRSAAVYSFFNEHLFFDAVQRYNRENPDKLITTSEARRMRSYAEWALTSQGYVGLNEGKVLEVRKAVNYTFKKMRQLEDNIITDETYEQALGAFTSALGLPQTYTNELGQKVTVAADTHGLPTGLLVSPYDPRLSNRKAMLDLGSRQGFITEKDIERVLEGDAAGVTELTSYSLPVHEVRSSDTGMYLRKLGTTYQKDDAIGLARLKKYMSEKDYERAARHLSFGRYQPMSEKAYQRAEGILEYLQNSGTEYSISPDLKAGQLKVHLTGTGIDVRLVDDLTSEHYVGRVYDSGAALYFSTNHRHKSAEGDYKYTRYEPTTEDVINLIKIAQGQPVARHDGLGLVGQQRVSQGTRRDKNGVSETFDNHDVYYRSQSYTATYGSLSQMESQGQFPAWAKVMVRKDLTNRGATTRYMADAEAAETFLVEATTSARENLLSEVTEENLLKDMEHYAQELHGIGWNDAKFDEAVKYLQERYAHPDTQVNQMREAIISEAMGQVNPRYDRMVEGVGPTLSASEVVARVREEFARAADYEVGTLVGTSEQFDASVVARWMDSSTGSFRNGDDIVKALRMTDSDASRLKTNNDFYLKTIKDRLIKFDAESAVPLAQVQDDFLRQMGQHLHESLTINGVQDIEIALDEQGIYQWSGRQAGGYDGDYRDIRGQLGQVFSPGEYGEVTTRFGSGENYMFVPGYEARILAQKPGENLSVEERTRLTGYEQKIKDSISYQVSSQVLMRDAASMEGVTVLNRVYQNLYQERYPVDYFERSAAEGLPRSWAEATLKTAAARVRYSNDIKNGSTIHAEYAKNSVDADVANDNYFDAYQLTGRRNMAVMGAEASGYFDAVVTGSGTNQGSVRYLVHDAQVAEDGSIIKGTEGASCALLEHEDAALMKYDPADRRQMTASNIMQARGITGPTQTAMTTLNGYTFEDGIAISKEFAERHQIYDVDGKLRPLEVGDKLSDYHGNKGVISVVIDRQRDAAGEWWAAMDLHEDTQGHEPHPGELDENLVEATKLFAQNPGLDVVMSPFSSVSRFNAGSGRELMQNTHPLTLPNGEVVEGGIGEAGFIVTHMSVDAKTKVYDEDKFLAGGGRAASSQLAWSLGSHEAYAVMDEMFGPNERALVNLRENLIVLGYDINETGQLQQGYTPQPGEEREVFTVAEPLLSKTGVLRTQAMVKEFGEKINQSGGILELPFNVTLANDMRTNQLPVMSAHLRSGREAIDGSLQTHEYTNNYLKIYENAARYLYAQQKVATGEPDKVAKYQPQLRQCIENVQQQYDNLAADVEYRTLTQKNNAIRTGIMNRKLPNSATAVWTANPSLDLDTVAVGADMMQKLGVKNQDTVLVWRDPQLRDAGLRSFSVVLDEKLTGIAINPVNAQTFDGDFDGDSVAVVALKNPKAISEAKAKLSVTANMLDKGRVREDGTYDFSFASGLDVQVAHHQDPELAERFEELRIAANDIEFDRQEGTLTDAQARREQSYVLGGLNAHYQECFKRSAGRATISFDSVESHLESIKAACIDTGAKGSMSKLETYARYLGAQMTEDGVTFDEDAYLVTQRDLDATQYATAVKSFGTGVAGAYSQRGVKALREEALTGVLETTYGATQAILQAKHDPVEARVRYEALMGPARALWRGEKIVKGESGEWRSFKDKGEPVILSADEWVQTYQDFAADKQGLNVPVNKEHLEAIAEAMKDSKGQMRSIEEVTDKMSALDRLAYGGSREVLAELAESQQNLFAGEVNAHFAPYSVRNNIQALHEARMQEAELLTEVTPQVRVLAKKDTQKKVATPAPVMEPVVESKVDEDDVDYGF